MRPVYLLAIPVLALLAACSSSGQGGGPATPAATSSTTVAAPTTAASATAASATAASTTAASTTAAPSTSGPAASSTPASPANKTSSPRTDGTENCTNSQLTVSSRQSSGGDSHGGIVVDFKNTSRTTCSLYGYPGAAALDRASRQFLQAKRTLGGYVAGCGCTHLTRVRLAAGRSASSVIEGDNGGGDECLRGHAVLVTAPNTTRAVHLPYLDAYSCQFQIHPVIAGTNGGDGH